MIDSSKEKLADTVAQYYVLDKQKKLLEGRLKELNKKIKDAYLEDKEVKPGTTLRETCDEYEVELQIKTPAAVDEVLLADLLVSKGLYDCFKVVPDLSLVRQAFIEGELTDTDFRELRGDQQVPISLRVIKNV